MCFTLSVTAMIASVNAAIYGRFGRDYTLLDVKLHHINIRLTFYNKNYVTLSTVT